VISDVHSNLPALEAVLESIEAVGPEEIWCLGDVVGYGAQPDECTAIVRERCAVSLNGNHDLAVTGAIDAATFSETARAAVRQASQLMDVREAFRQRLGRKPNALKLLDELFVNPYVTAARAARVLGVSGPTARHAIALLQEEGVLGEMTGRSWGRVYLARPILQILEARG